MEHSRSKLLSVSFRQLTIASLLLTNFLLLSQSASAQPIATGDIAEDIGLTQLRIAYPELTEGLGIKAHLVEARQSVRSEGRFGHAPNPDSAEFSRNTINIISVSNSVSAADVFVSHAQSSARHFFGSLGVARDLGTDGLSIDSYSLSEWFTLVVNNSRDPDLSEFDRSTVSSHSYISAPDVFIPFVQRLDHIINETDTTTVTGTGNSGALPFLWTSSYNGIAAGLSNGRHAAGLTTGYGRGRVAIDVVCPVSNSSTATPLVAGAVAILQDAADGSDASTSEVIRATILAGATKDAGDIDGTWSRTTTRPLDAIYGAGELNILNSYHIQQGGEFDGGSIDPVSLLGFNGWDYENNLELNGQRLYEFEVPAGSQLEDFSVVLAWNQNIVDTNSSPDVFEPVEALANLSLELLNSNGEVVDFSFSNVDNVEHVYQPTLAAGTYQLRVSNDDGLPSDFGMAWRGNHVTTTLLGDCNRDGVVNFLDISMFIPVLVTGAYLEEADCNQDGTVSFSDIGPFAAILNDR